jgi:phosphatidylserine/phosphatidylglycerophosphate/cardiolipin synthase-like enzyme
MELIKLCIESIAAFIGGALCTKLYFDTKNPKKSSRIPKSVLFFPVCPAKFTEAGKYVSEWTPKSVRYSGTDNDLLLMISCLTSAQKSVDVCVYTMNSNICLVELLKKLGLAGICVRVICCYTEKRDETVSFLRSTRNVKVKMLHMSKDDSIVHHKFFTVDREIVGIGSSNWNNSSFADNQEAVMLVDEPSVVNNYGNIFDQLIAQIEQQENDRIENSRLL